MREKEKEEDKKRENQMQIQAKWGRLEFSTGFAQSRGFLHTHELTKNKGSEIYPPPLPSHTLVCPPPPAMQGRFFTYALSDHRSMYCTP